MALHRGPQLLPEESLQLGRQGLGERQDVGGEVVPHGTGVEHGGSHGAHLAVADYHVPHGTLVGEVHVDTGQHQLVGCGEAVPCLVPVPSPAGDDQMHLCTGEHRQPHAVVQHLVGDQILEGHVDAFLCTHDQRHVLGYRRTLPARIGTSGCYLDDITAMGSRHHIHIEGFPGSERPIGREALREPACGGALHTNDGLRTGICYGTVDDDDAPEQTVAVLQGKRGGEPAVERREVSPWGYDTADTVCPAEAVGTGDETNIDATGGSIA